MPALSPTMEKGNLAKWLKREGEPVKPGDVIAEIETDKATMEVEAIDEGTLGKILVPEGTERRRREHADRRDSVRGRGRRRAGAATEGRRVGAACRPADHARSGAAEISGRGAAPPGNLAGARGAGRHRDDDHDGARSAARRDGRGDAPRRRRVRDRRGGGRVSGRLQGYAGAAAGIRRPARDRHADHGARICRARHRGRARGPQTGGRVHDLQFRHAGDRSALSIQQPRRVTCRADRSPYPIVFRGPNGAGRARGGAAQPGLFRLVFARSGPQGGRALHRGRCERPAQGGDPRSQSGHLSRERNSLRPELSESEARRLRCPHRQGQDRARRAAT